MPTASQLRKKPMPNRRVCIWEDFNQIFWTGYNGNDGDGPVSIRWFDKTGTFELKNNIVVEIELMERGYANHYVGYMVRLIHKTSGPLTKHFFKFDDYLEEREDDRADYPVGGNNCFHATGDAKWYVAKPSFDDIAEMQSKIMNFISHYGDPLNRMA